MDLHVLLIKYGEKMEYHLHYQQLVERAKSRVLEGYTEIHHVIPRCLGGLDSQENLVTLTAEEHYVAHQLLVKMFPGHYGLVKAANMMSTGNQRSNKRYGWLRRQLFEECKETVECKHCSKEFSMPQSLKRVYCSNECYRASRTKMIDRTCECCGEVFSVYGSRETKCCSTKCARILRFGKKRVVKCKGCGTEFTTRPSGTTIYCTRECYTTNAEPYLR